MPVKSMTLVPSVEKSTINHTQNIHGIFAFEFLKHRVLRHEKVWRQVTNGAAALKDHASSVRSLCERSSRGFPQERRPSFLLAICAA